LGTRIPDGRPVPSAGKTQDVNREAGPQNPKKADNNIKIGPGAKNSGAIFPSKTVFSGRESRTIESNLPLSNTILPNIPIEKTVDISGAGTVSARELFKEIARILGLPLDSLSVSLIAFFRFFSLSPDPSLLRTLRREILSSQKTSSPGTAKGKAALEAKALALVSAFDKGVELSKDALERYAGYFEPRVFSQGEDGKDAEKKDDLLDIMNSLPGKNGRYWKLIPFKIDVGGTELEVFLRLLKREPLCPGESEYVIADIAGPKRQWRCILEKTGEKLRADIRIFPGLPAKALRKLEGEAGRFLKGSEMGDFSGFDEVKVRNGEEMPSWMEDLCNKRLPSVNEEV